MIIGFAFLILLCGTCGYAFACGCPSQRGVAAVMLAGALLSPLFAHSGDRLWHGSEAGIFLIDVAALAAIYAIMLRSNRFWPIWTTGFQLLTVAAHLGPLFRVRMLAVPFALDEEIWSWMILVQLGLVTWSSQRRSRRSPMPP